MPLHNAFALPEQVALLTLRSLSLSHMEAISTEALSSRLPLRGYVIWGGKHVTSKDGSTKTAPSQKPCRGDAASVCVCFERQIKRPDHSRLLTIDFLLCVPIYTVITPHTNTTHRHTPLRQLMLRLPSGERLTTAYQPLAPHTAGTEAQSVGWGVETRERSSWCKTDRDVVVGRQKNWWRMTDKKRKVEKCQTCKKDQKWDFDGQSAVEVRYCMIEQRGNISFISAQSKNHCLSLRKH